MKRQIKWSMVAWMWLLVISAPAALVVQVAPPKSTGSRAIVKLDLQNTYDVKIQSVRAVAFLINDQGKVVGQLASWIIGGGGKEKRALDPNAKTTYNFVVTTDKPFVKAKLIVTRVLLDDGKLGNLQEVQIQDSTN